MRRAGRRGLSHDFPSSGEDSFVAVVVTKLTGALLFILLVSLVILALVPKGSPEPGTNAAIHKDPNRLEIITPARLPDAISGRAYQVALACKGSSESTRWNLAGELPRGLEFDEQSGLISGTPTSVRAEPYSFEITCADDTNASSAVFELTILSAAGETAIQSLNAGHGAILPRMTWREWAEHGVGFVLIGLVAWVGLASLDGLERQRLTGIPQVEANNSVRTRFRFYRVILGSAGIVACGLLGIWLAWPAAS